MDNYVGKRLDGRYEVQEIVGVGGMSVVYKAYDNVDDRIVAIKILKDEFLNNEEFKRRFKNESKAIALLSHPNIVKVYDVDFDEEMEFKLVGSTEANSLENKISNESPVGHALIGKRVGDVVDVETQSGVIQYKVLDIKRVD